MRELSAQERAFLQATLPEPMGNAGEASGNAKLRRKSPLGRISAFFGAILRHLPLAIGIITLLVAALLTYLYIWGRDLFKISDVERMNADGTLGLMEQASGQWITDILAIFDVAPWVILGTVVLGILLMGVSMLLVGKRKDG